MSKNIRKIIKICIIILFAISLILSSIVSQNEHHLEICNDEHCSVCALIHMAQMIMSLIVMTIIYASVGFLIYFFLSMLHKTDEVFVQQSLVFQKVQLNE